MHSFLKLIETFDTDNHARGVQFEKLCKWLLENHPLYKSKLKQVWLWDDWPERWGKDCGIDLVAEDVDGKTWAIQAKCYDPKYNVTKKDVDSFLSESTNTKIHHRLLIATTDGLGANAVGVIQRQNETIPVNQLMLSDLLEAPIEWPKSLEDISTATIKKAFKPKPYQQIAIDKVVENLDSRGQLIMACGTGKTLTGLWIAEELKAETTLVLLPSLLLLSKTLTEWLTHSKEPFAYLPVCSDDTVARSEDAINLFTSDLSFPSTTDAEEIAKFVKSDGRKVIFSTYQSSERIAEAFKLNALSPIDLIIADEAHRCAGKADSAYSTVLDNEQIPAVKRLFMTATPRIFQSSFKKKASDSGVEVVSMDDETVFGAVLHKLSFGEAIEQDLLTDYQVVVVGIDNPSYSAMITERTLVKTDTDIQSDAQSFASHIGLAKAIKKYDLTRVISFHSRVSSARDFANKLPEVIEWMPSENKPDGELLTNHVSGAMPTNERNKNLQALGNITDDQRYILSNARCLSEGVDVPALDGVAFIDPRNSEIDIVQAVGRAIRLSKGKAVGSIVIPVFIEDHEAPDEVLNSSPFKKVWAVVNALRSHDEGLGEELDQLRQAIGRRGTVGKSDKIIFDLPTTITHQFETALKTKVVEATTASWEFWFGLLETYKQKNGDTLVPAKYITPSGYKLGVWTAHLRSTQARLDSCRLQYLSNIGFIFDILEHNWNKGFSALVKYKEEFGDSNVPMTYKTSEGFRLGGWIGRQRQEKNQNRMPTHRLNRLEKIGVIWNVSDQLWKKRIEALKSFKKEYGHLLVPQSYVTSSGMGLGKWVIFARVNIDSLSTEQLAYLNKLEFIWSPLEVQWEEGLNELVAYKDHFGDCLVKTFYKSSSGFRLGQWVVVQRQKKEISTLERIKRLDDVGFIWDKFQYQWDNFFKQLVLYKNTHGHCAVPRRYKTNTAIGLGSWVQQQRKLKASMPKNRIDSLDQLGFIWDQLQENWEEGFEELVKYKNKSGHLRVPVKYKTSSGYRLGIWVNSQMGWKLKMDKDRLSRLDDIGFLWARKK